MRKPAAALAVTPFLADAPLCSRPSCAGAQTELGVDCNGSGCWVCPTCGWRPYYMVDADRFDAAMAFSRAYHPAFPGCLSRFDIEHFQTVPLGLSVYKSVQSDDLIYGE
jgi:hypothetical protein